MKTLLVFLILISTQAQARVFSITQSSFASYFKGTFGMSSLQKDPYNKISGAQTEISTETDFNLSGEFGVVFPSPNYAFRLGLEILAPRTPSGIQGKNSSGTELMSLDSRVLGFFPTAHLEYYIAKNSLGRVYLSVGGGYGKVSLKNNYTFTAAGDTAYNPLTSFSDRASQYTYLVETSLGYEMAFIQTVTFVFDFGYRYCVVRDLKYDGAGTNFIGTHPAGDPVIDSSGDHKTLDLGGVFTGLSFRFYFE